MTGGGKLQVFSPAQRAVLVCPIFCLVIIFVFRKTHTYTVFGKMKNQNNFFSSSLASETIATTTSTTFSSSFSSTLLSPPFLLHFLTFTLQRINLYVKFLAQCLAHNSDLIKYLLLHFFSQACVQPLKMPNTYHNYRMYNKGPQFLISGRTAILSLYMGLNLWGCRSGYLRRL